MWSDCRRHTQGHTLENAAVHHSIDHICGASMNSPGDMARGNEMNGYAKIDQYNAAAVERLSKTYRSVLEELGEDPDREGLVKTPERVAKALQFLTHGRFLDPAAILRSAMFKEEYKQMVIVKDIEVYSLCEH